MDRCAWFRFMVIGPKSLPFTMAAAEPGRLQGAELVMTQELIANMLGVRREGVTEGALKSQQAGLIRYARGHISVLDRDGLERRSCECYAAVKKEYDRLLPQKPAA
jgi:hypothetical protein